MSNRHVEFAARAIETELGLSAYYWHPMIPNDPGPVPGYGGASGVAQWMTDSLQVVRHFNGLIAPLGPIAMTAAQRRALISKPLRDFQNALAAAADKLLREKNIEQQAALKLAAVGTAGASA